MYRFRFSDFRQVGAINTTALSTSQVKKRQSEFEKKRNAGSLCLFLVGLKSDNKVPDGMVPGLR
jgi:hypothetical protein